MIVAILFIPKAILIYLFYKKFFPFVHSLKKHLLK